MQSASPSNTASSVGASAPNSACSMAGSSNRPCRYRPSTLPPGFCTATPASCCQAPCTAPKRWRVGRTVLVASKLVTSGSRPRPGPLPSTPTVSISASPSICRPPQMLGEALIDTVGVDGNGPGLGLLPLVTSFEATKTVRPTRQRFGAVQGAWQQLAGVAVQGYEIHHGQTAQHPAMAASGDVARELIPGLAWQNPGGNVLGQYLRS